MATRVVQLLLAFIFASQAKAATVKKVSIRTTRTLQEAGTDSAVILIAKGERENCTIASLDLPYKDDRQRGAIDVYKVSKEN